MNAIAPKPWVHQLYAKAARSVPAYRAVLKQHTARVRTSAEVIQYAPILDKKSYILKHSFTDLSIDKRLAPIMHASSGSSGTPTYWLRNFAQEHNVALDRQTIFQDYFGFKKTEKTLAIVAFGMGVWVAGSMEAAAYKLLAEKHGWQITVATPGIEKRDIAGILKHTAANYANVVLIGYPAFIMDALQYCKQQQIQLNDRFRLLLAGEAITEAFRESFIRLIGTPSKSKTLQVVNIYGAADVGQIGFETPLTVELRRLLEAHPELHMSILGKQTDKVPALYQWNPDHIYIESHKGELLLTAPTGIPLIRYNIHDQGQVFTGQDILPQLKSYMSPHRLHELGQTKFPFVSHNGRTDVAVSYYAINIYPNHILSALQSPSIQNLVTQSYFTKHTYSKDHSKETWKLYVEVKKSATKKALEKIATAVTDTMLKVSIEYRKLFSTLGKSAKPKIIAITNMQHIPVRELNHGMLYMHGKKPKMLL